MATPTTPTASINEQNAAADRLTGIALMTGSAASVQLGAATAALAFPVLGPAGVVAIRQWVAGIVLLSAVRPKFGSFTRQQWRLILTLALIFAIMNLSLYVAIDRIGLGLAVTLESLGPLSVALLASRRVIDLGCALIAGGAAVVLARPQPSTDYTGILLALLAAACWAGYILVNRVVGARVPGAQGPAAAAGLSAEHSDESDRPVRGFSITCRAGGRVAADAGFCSPLGHLLGVWSVVCHFRREDASVAAVRQVPVMRSLSATASPQAGQSPPGPMRLHGRLQLSHHWRPVWRWPHSPHS